MTTDKGKLRLRAIPDGAVEGWWQAGDGHTIRRIDLSPPVGMAPRGSLLFMPGRGDCYEKWLEALEHWRARGFHVTALDWRGQAGSGRLGPTERIGHIDDFALWIADLAGFWRVFVGETPEPHGLIGHSMGGHLALRAVAEGAVAPAFTVLSAPMVEMFAWGLPLAVQRVLAWVMVHLGDPRRAAWADGEKPSVGKAIRMALLTHDTERYQAELDWRAQRPFLEMGPASWGWMRASVESSARLWGMLARVVSPVLILSTRTDRLVSHRAAARAAEILPAGELVTFGPEARHEILREVDSVRDHALAMIDGFIDRQLAALPARQA